MANKGDGTMKDLEKYIARALVDNPEQVEVSERLVNSEISQI